MTRRIALDRPPETNRIDGVILRDWCPLPRIGEAVEVEVVRGQWKAVGWVCEVDREKGEYSVELDGVDNGREM